MENWEELETGHIRNPIILNYRSEVKKQRKDIELLKKEIDNIWNMLSKINEEFKLRYRIIKLNSDKN